MFSFLKIRFYLRKNLSNYRYKHSIRVAKEAKKLAKLYGANENDAYLAGLLHDIAKEYNNKVNENLVHKYKLSEDLLKNSKINHAIIGSLLAKSLYGVNDNVVTAIKYHSIGNIKMNLLDKIVFVADKIESGKNYFGIEEERRLAYIDIDKCLLLCLKNTKTSLASKGKILHQDTEELINFLESRIKC